MKRNASKPKNIKEDNIRLILSKLYENEEMTVQDLSKVTGISKTTVNKVMAELLGKGIVLPGGKGCSTAEGGRKPEVYRFHDQYRYIISTELYEDSVYCCIMDLGCKIIYNDMDEFPCSLSFDEAILRLREHIKKALHMMSLSSEQIGAVTVSCSAIVSEEKGTIERTTIGSWSGDLSVSANIADLFPEGTSIIVNNISRFSGYAELKQQPKLRDERVVTLLFWDDTVGGSMMSDGQFENGSNNLIGEIGHIVMENGYSYEKEPFDDGHFEGLVNSKAVMNYAYEQGPHFPDSSLYPKIKSQSLTLDDIFKAYRKKDALALDIVSRSAYYIALMIHYLLIIYDPKYFILQGFYDQAGQPFIDTLYELVAKLVPFCDVRSLVIEHSSYGREYKSAFNIGAGLYAVEFLIKHCFFTIE